MGSNYLMATVPVREDSFILTAKSSSVSSSKFGHPSTMLRLNLFLETILCDTFKQTSVGDTGIHMVFNLTILSVLLKLNA